jgi:hypothetical protein
LTHSTPLKFHTFNNILPISEDSRHHFNQQTYALLAAPEVISKKRLIDDEDPPENIGLFSEYGG